MDDGLWCPKFAQSIQSSMIFKPSFASRQLTKIFWGNKSPLLLSQMNPVFQNNQNDMNYDDFNFSHFVESLALALYTALCGIY